jgi:hypothetical protein
VNTPILLELKDVVAFHKIFGISMIALAHPTAVSRQNPLIRSGRIFNAQLLKTFHCSLIQIFAV